MLLLLTLERYISERRLDLGFEQFCAQANPDSDKVVTIVLLQLRQVDSRGGTGSIGEAACADAADELGLDDGGGGLSILIVLSSSVGHGKGAAACTAAAEEDDEDVVTAAAARALAELLPMLGGAPAS